MQFVVITLFSALFAIQVVRCQKNYGDSCKTTTSDNGVCMPSSECVLTDSEPTSCSYSGLVCCDKHYTSTSINLDNRESLRDRYSSTNDEINFPPEKINSPIEEYFPSSDSNSESKSFEENRSRWSTKHKPTHHSIYSHGRYDDGYGSFNSYRPNNKPSIYRPSYNKPTGNSFNYHDDSSSFGKEDNGGWRPRTTTSRPVWALETSEETKTFGPRRKRISQIKCEEYSRPITETVRALPLSLNADVVPITVQKCDFTAAKLIVGGVVAEVGEFPHMAAVGFRAKDGNIMWNCGGSLISEQYVMTAGHCANTTYGNPVIVRLGEHNLSDDNDNAQPEDYQVAQVIPHPRYKSSVKYNDIALLRLETPVRLTDKIRPACLSSSESYTDKPIATGWGRTHFVGKLSDVLMKVGLSIIDNKVCNDLYKQDIVNARFFKQGIVDSMLCAGALQGGKDTCLGDSGGPLQITNEDNRCLYHIIGITSFGKVCGAENSPGVYTRVSKFLPWIENTVWGRT